MKLLTWKHRVLNLGKSVGTELTAAMAPGLIDTEVCSEDILNSVIENAHEGLTTLAV